MNVSRVMCPLCHQRAISFTYMGHKEVKNTGICELCFDRFTKDTLKLKKLRLTFKEDNMIITTKKIKRHLVAKGYFRELHLEPEVDVGIGVIPMFTLICLKTHKPYSGYNINYNTFDILRKLNLSDKHFLYIYNIKKNKVIKNGLPF